MLSGFFLPVLEYCSAVWCSAADTHLKLLDRVVSGARFLTGGVFECDLAHRRSVVVLCMLYKFRCIPMHPIYGASACTINMVPIFVVPYMLVLAKLLAPFSSPTFFPFSSFILWVGIVGLGSSD